jgi:phage head morphogenesis protein, SPP1 gp7 family
LNNKSPVAVYGDRITVEPDKSSAVRYLLNSSADRTLTVLHNHPGQSSFSANDLSFFMTNQSVKTLTIVTNQGKVMYLTKVSGYDYVKARNLAKTVELKDGNYDEYVAKVIKRMYDGGVESKIR